MGSKESRHSGSAQRSWSRTAIAAAQIAGHIVSPWRRRWRREWGAQPDELSAELPGDELIPDPAWTYTHAISIEAPAEQVWPWIVQLGQERGGFASFERLENLFGCRIHNADHIVEEWQHPAVGDIVHLHPAAPPLHIAVLEPGRSFVLLGAPVDDVAAATANLWAFHLLPDGPNRCRLVERGRTVHGDSLQERLFFGTAMIEPVGFVMSREMLRSLKELAETSRVAAGAR
jgi:hypothetical protein